MQTQPGVDGGGGECGGGGRGRGRCGERVQSTGRSVRGPARHFPACPSLAGVVVRVPLQQRDKGALKQRCTPGCTHVFYRETDIQDWIVNVEEIGNE